MNLNKIVTLVLILVYNLSLLLSSNISTNPLGLKEEFDNTEDTTIVNRDSTYGIQEFMTIQNVQTNYNDSTPAPVSKEELDNTDEMTIVNKESTNGDQEGLPVQDLQHDYNGSTPALFPNEEFDNDYDHDNDYSDDMTMVIQDSTTGKEEVIKTQHPESDYDQFDNQHSLPWNVHKKLSEVVGKRVGNDAADSILKSNFKIHDFDYRDWKEWVIFDEHQIYCRSGLDCEWISAELECQNITLREVVASWFRRRNIQSLGKCSCPESFDLGFSWNDQTCVNREQQWVIIVMSLLACLGGTILLLLLAHIQDILVSCGLRKRSLPTPTNSSIGRYPSIQK